MKKLIELNDNLIVRLEALQERFNVKSLAPIVDIVLTIGLTHFEDFANGSIYTIHYPTYPSWYPCYDFTNMTGNYTITPEWSGNDWIFKYNSTTITTGDQDGIKT